MKNETNNNEIRELRLPVRVNQAEINKVSADAHLNGNSLAGYIRAKLDLPTVKRGRKPSTLGNQSPETTK